MIMGDTEADMVRMTIKRGTCVVMGLRAVFINDYYPALLWY